MILRFIHDISTVHPFSLLNSSPLYEYSSLPIYLLMDTELFPGLATKNKAAMNIYAQVLVRTYTFIYLGAK